MCCLTPEDIARYQLTFMPGIGAATMQKLHYISNDPKEILHAQPEELVKSGIDSNLAQAIHQAGKSSDESDQQLQDFLGLGGRLLYPDQTNLPSRLSNAPASWSGLTCLGCIKILQRPLLIGIVGRRTAGEEAMGFTSELAEVLAAKQIPTISGMARGIDSAAHCGSLQSGGETIAVIPQGLLTVIRQRHLIPPASLEGDHGSLLLLSGVGLCGEWATAEAFRRNNWIAEWSDVLVVVEAGPKGGTWRTARHAAKIGRPVWVADNFADQDPSRKNHELAKTIGAARLDVQKSIDHQVDQIIASSETDTLWS